ncbi:MAG: hypothetical protein Q8Q25_01165, partial [bacterium]|nr:hypothetical protein [bacterium]
SMAYTSLTYILVRGTIMVVIETAIFTKLVQQHLTDDEYRELQVFLALNPEAGDIIKGSGGLRKVRWRHKRRGKRGGVRLIYYWQTFRGHPLV